MQFKNLAISGAVVSAIIWGGAAIAEPRIHSADYTFGRPHDVLEGHKHQVSSVAFSPDGKTLATGSGDRAIIWDVGQ